MGTHMTKQIALMLMLSMGGTALAQQRAADGVTINDDGNPHIDVLAVRDRSGHRPVGRKRDDARAVCRPRRPARARRRRRRLHAGVDDGRVRTEGPRFDGERCRASAAIAELLSDDQQRESRQLGMIDMKGRSAAHTGKGNNFWAGSKQGKTYTVQANIMVGPEVVEAVAATFEASEGTGMPLAERMILAMEAGQAKGGDSRWGNLQSAAIKIADPNDPGRGGDHIALAIEVGEHPEPVAEMKRIYYTTGRRLGYRAFSRVEGADVIELKRMLHALGYWRPSLASFPDAPPNANSPKMQELRKQDPAAYDKAIAAARQASAAYTREYAVYDDEAIVGGGQVSRRSQAQLPGQSAGIGGPTFRRRAEGRLPREAQGRPVIHRLDTDNLCLSS